MDHLTKYIDWYIRTMITCNPEWQKLNVIYSNEKVPGEGEHKIMHYLKKYANNNERICIYGLDADLMMLGILLPFDYIWIAREPESGYIEFVNVRTFSDALIHLMKWDRDFISNSEPVFDKEAAINDFILLSTLVGNDFLPTIPTITILDGAIDSILSIYRQVGKIYGHLTIDLDGMLVVNPNSLENFFKEFSKIEQTMCEKKYNSQQSFFPDPLIVKNMKFMNQKHVINMEKYKNDYYEAKFPQGITIEKIVHEYVRGMIWILNYYKNGIPDWIWFFPYFYGPFLTDLAKHITPESIESISTFTKNDPVPPFLQLLLVLPQSSKELIPEPLNSLLDDNSPLKFYFPDTFEIDMTGKRKDWEAIVILPVIRFDDFKLHYESLEKNINPMDKKRNIFGKNFIYKHDPDRSDVFSSFYGNIPECPVSVFLLHF
jgi:5'-3' exoribonuclease 1